MYVNSNNNNGDNNNDNNNNNNNNNNSYLRRVETKYPYICSKFIYIIFKRITIFYFITELFNYLKFFL